MAKPHPKNNYLKKKDIKYTLPARTPKSVGVGVSPETPFEQPEEEQGQAAPPPTPATSPAENKEENEGGENPEDGGTQKPEGEDKGGDKEVSDKSKEQGGAAEAIGNKVGKAAGDKVKKEAVEAATTIATGGAAKIGIFLAKYGKYIIIFFIFALILIYFILLSGIFGGSGPQVPLDAQKNARDIAKVKAVALASTGKSNNDALYKQITETSLKESVTNLKNYLAQNQNGLDPGEISDLNTKLDAILNEFNTIKPDLDSLRTLEAIPETELKLKDPDQFTQRKDLRTKVDASFTKMWTSIREIFNQLGLNNA